MSFLRHIRLLLWKNYILQLRHPWVTLFEVLIPCLFVAMIAIIRVQVEVTPYTNTTEYASFEIYHLPNMSDQIPSSGPKVFTYKILFAPDDAPHLLIIENVMDKLSKLNKLGKFKDHYEFEAESHPTEDSLVESYRQNSSISLLCGIVFEEHTDHEFKFKLRFESSPKHQRGDALVKSWSTKNTFPQFSRPGPRFAGQPEGGSPGYWEDGFLLIQHVVSMAIINSPNTESITVAPEDIEVIAQRFPYPPYIDDEFLLALQFLFPIILMFSFIYPAVNQTKNLVLEKEKRLKESMKMMGLKDWMHWFAWFTKSQIWLSVSVGLITLLLCIKLKDGVGILNKSDGSVVFVYFFLYSMTTISFSFMISTIFSKANVAGVGTGVLFFLTFMPYFTTAQRYLDSSLVYKLSVSLLHNTNMAFGAIVISMWEGNQVGLQWEHLNDVASPDDTLTMAMVFIMFIIDTIIYLLITWYISNVFPGEYGIPQKWYFPVSKTYWCGYQYEDSSGHDNHGFEMFNKDEVDSNNKSGSNYYEKEPRGLSKGIEIKGLCKSFDGGQTFAVNNLNLTTYSGQITALLGHNGAGKTTTMSIITGLFPPTRGTAIVNNFDIRTNMDSVRSSLGICPQFDVLFDELTVEEHLRFYCQLKNVTDPEVVEQEITDMIAMLALEDKRFAQSHTLSGGMKRKLSVGIALIGDSKIVILDEPTSGMDVSARRFIWDLLMEVKQNRTILLSTHFMEEADVLGDRIAIMANGKLQCCGSPLFLKKKYGAGYHLTISKSSNKTDPTAITDLIKAHIPNAKLETSAGTELAFSLPNEDTFKFEGLFADIEDNQKELGIDSFGASITTMEEVFLKVGEYAEEGIKAINSNQNGKHENGNHLEIEMDSVDGPLRQERNKGFTLWGQQFYGLIVKKLLYGYRNPFLSLSQLLLPALFTISAILIMRTNPSPSDAPALELNLDNFKSTRTRFFYHTYESDNALSRQYGALNNTKDGFIAEPTDDTNLTAFAIDKLNQLSTSDLSNYNLHQPIAAIFDANVKNSNQTVTALFNNQAFHTPAISLRYVDNAIIRQALNRSDFNLRVVNHPMPRTPSELLLSVQYQSQAQFQFAQSLMFAMSFLSASFVVLLVRERSIKGKHLQMVCGVKLYIFWITSYILDFLTYIIPCCFIMILYKAFNEEALSSPEQEARLFLLFVVHGGAMLPFVYLLSFLFDIPSTAYVRICLYNVILGIGTFLAVIITELPALKVVYVSKILNVVFSVFLPNFVLGRSVYNLYNNYLGNDICNTRRNITLGHSIADLCPLIGGDNSLAKMLEPARVCCKDKCGDNCFPWDENYLSLETPGIGQLLLWLCFQCVFYWIGIVLIEYHVFRNIKYFFANRNVVYEDDETNDINGNQYSKDDAIDEDVIKEAQRLHLPDMDLLSENALLIRKLRKNYGSFRAVDNISYGVGKGECFGLLGINGAGKTTTFKMITGDEPISDGDIFVNGFNVKTNIQRVQRQIGYCPQFDGLLDQLTGRETLTLFSRLRGIKECEIPCIISEISRVLYFDMHLDKQVGKYSGGTKRKLSTAVALLGNPSVSFLDEPTTGVDPVARRCLWDALTKKLSEGISIVLTSHSMEECEALCNRLIIMVNGRICCIGSPQHLKNKFGKGYTVLIKVSNNGPTDGLNRQLSRPPADGVNRQMSRQISRQFSRQLSTLSQNKRRSLESEKISKLVYNRQASEMIVAQNLIDVKDFMQTAFPGCQLKAIHCNLLQYSITDEKLSWSEIFGRIERVKDRINIEDYSVGQTTLEQIFLSFARKQREASN